MRKPTDKEIREAKAYIRKRVQAELLLSKHLEDALLDAARKIVEISYRYNIAPSRFQFSANARLQKDVDNVIEDLMELLMEQTSEMVGDIATDEEEEDELMLLLNREKYGKTFRERVDEYTSRFRKELEASLAAALMLKVGKQQALSNIRSSMKQPYMNKDFRNAIGKGMRGSAERLLSGGVSYGRGRSNSAATSLEKLLRMELGGAYMEHLRNTSEGATGYWVMRGSSYPCDECDDEVGYHPIEDFTGEIHDNCRCIFIFV